MTKRKNYLRAAWIMLLALAVVAPVVFVSSAAAKRPAAAAGLDAPERPLPTTFDVRGPDGLMRGTALRAPTAAQAKALNSLQSKSGVQLQVRYNGLTATPSHLFSLAGYLSAPSNNPPEVIARDFLNRWKGIFRFSQEDVDTLRLKSRAYVRDLGATILVFEQRAKELPVYHGEMMVNVNRAGQIIDVGSESFPQLQLAGGYTLTAAQVIEAAAAALDIKEFAPQSLGQAQVLRSFGDAPVVYASGEKFSGGRVFTDDIIATRVAFPMGEKARPAYEFTLTTPQYNGIMWLNIVDAQTGQVLRRSSLTAFQRKGAASKLAGAPAPNFGPPGGGNGTGRLPTFRPDLQDRLEAQNNAGTAQGSVFDAVPTALSGRFGVGRSPAPGTPPTYASESQTVRNNGRGFKFSLVDARRENPLVYNVPFGQATRGIPDAQNPSAESPFGWFYLPTNTGGAEITVADNNRATTEAYGYTMATEAKTRNDAANSPNGDKDQPFSATLTAITPKTIADGRTLAQVFQSNYTEGNNAIIADDRENDNATTRGIRGFSATRQFNTPLFAFVNGYEYGGMDATEEGACTNPLGGDCFVNYPPSSNPDVYPGAVSLFYFNNIMHDYMYSIGFTEALWNFQQDNFGKGGTGKDGVQAEVQDGSGTDNANFSTPTDGNNPRMQMYLFTETTFRRSDGSLDFDVVGHEWTHGTSNRSVGKGDMDCLGVGLVGEPGGEGEGWSDYYASSMTDDDSEGEYVTGEFDKGIRRLPYTNYRWSYGAANGNVLNRRDQQPPDSNPGATPYEVHNIGELWCATLWDMRELLIEKDPNGQFFDNDRRLGAGTNFFIGYHQVQSVDTQHPINYRASFNDSNGITPTINAATHIQRPARIAAEIAANAGSRNGPLATAVRNGARLSDTLVLRGMQLSICNPSFVDSRDSILLADREMTGGENQALIWRAFASHGVGVLATSDTSSDPSGNTAPVIVEDFSVPAGVTQCETLGPLAPPSYSLSNTQPNVVTVTIVPEAGAALYIISRASSANGPFVVIGTTTTTTFNDDNGGQGLSAGQTFYYQVRASRTTDQTCVSTANTQSITVVVGVVITPAPVFAGVDQVLDPAACNRLIVSWQPALSLNPNADIVYDVYRTDEINPDTVPDPTFTPSAANRIAQDLRALSYIDTNNGAGLKLNRVQYYIVQARDVNNGKLDTNNTGNASTKFNAPSAPGVTASAPFAFEDFETTNADTRFVPPLAESGNDPNNAVQNFQRVTGVQVGNVSTSLMFAPDFDPPDDGTGATSNFSATIGPLSLQPTSVLEFDHFFNTEATFDGGTLEISSDPSFGGNNATPFPNNTTTYDLGNYIVQGGYNGKLDGTLAGGVILSPLQGRRAYTGAKGLHHVRVPLEDFATGGQKNAGGLPMYIRFHMTSDVATSAGPNSGWYIDNVVVHNLDLGSCPALNPFQPGDVLISEFRTRGAAGGTDEFIELYNNTSAPIQVSSGDGSGGWGVVADISGSPQLIATIANGTNIPARGHYLLANSTNPGGYSLGSYPAGNSGATATPDANYTTDIPDGVGLALFSTANLASIGTTNRIDAVGFTSEGSTLFKEGAGLSSPGANDGEYSFVRRMAITGLPRDTNDNASDFAFVSTTGAQIGGVQSTLGAPGPENSTSPIQRNATIKASAIDPQCASGTSTDPTSACSRVRNSSDTGPNKTFGTLSLRRRFKNTSNQAVTRLRFRIVDITTLGNRAQNEADLRVLDAPDITVTTSSNQMVPVRGTTIETPPAQTLGGGLNTSLTVGTITTASPIAPGASVNVQFLLGVEAAGSFRFFVNVEALP
ncbi:MAG: M36 family metallopeptidase [Pyrinomonadaceae bacterium]